MEVLFMTEEISSQATRFIRNPDVVLHEEEPDGALIYNPDTDQIRVLNQTGFFVWQLCDGSHDMQSLVAGVRDSFDEVPDDNVSGQVEDFVNEMVSVGFIGTVEEEGV
jgi:hypothetical protein